MGRPKSEVERFDALFERLDTMAGSDIDTFQDKVRQVESAGKAEHSGTRYIKEKKCGKEIIRFMIFSSSLKSEETKELLYSPAITAFTGQRKFKPIHVKRRDLEYEPTSFQEKQRQRKLIRGLIKIEGLFNEHEKSVE